MKSEVHKNSCRQNLQNCQASNLALTFSADKAEENTVSYRTCTAKKIKT